METVSLTIDGRQLTVEKGKTVLQAALENGIAVPYYCYHPGLGIDGSCRVCIVKVEKMPKLQTSCSTYCTEGMVVSTRSEEVVAARAGVFEFLLVNHPLDCPVCDKGGECPLQDFSYTFGPDQSRMEFPRRTFDGDGARADVDFGPSLMLNRNRCILCTRCVRFMRDVEGDAQINVVDRGYGSEIATFGEQGVHSLLSGNLMDVCPVGAITTRDYRFKARPWDNPLVADTVCTLCSKGCSTTAWIKAKPEWAKGSRLVRFTPRFNPQVNGYWMCDIGRFGYHWIESDDRLRRPLVREASGAQTPVSWHDALSKLGDRLNDAGRNRPDGVRFLLSAHASNEELFLVGRLVEALLGVPGGASASGKPAPITVSWRVSPKQQPPRSTFKIADTDAPNVRGAELLGLVPGRARTAEPFAPDVAALRDAVEAGRVAALYVLDPGPDGSLGDVSWILEARAKERLPLLVVHGVLMTNLARAADIVLPGATWLEKEASYTNDQGLLQGTGRAIPAPGEATEDWQVLVRLSAMLGIALPFDSSAAVRAAIAAAHIEGLEGAGTIVFGRPGGPRHWLQGSNPSERWKWDVLFQDLPPVKGTVDPVALPLPPGAIPLKEVKVEK